MSVKRKVTVPKRRSRRTGWNILERAPDRAGHDPVEILLGRDTHALFNLECDGATEELDAPARGVSPAL